MLIFEKSRPGRGCDLLPECDVEVTLPQEKDKREKKLHLPELSEIELSRHYTELAKKSHGVNDGFYPLGSCTMKYNPKINEEIIHTDNFAKLHPLQSAIHCSRHIRYRDAWKSSKNLKIFSARSQVWIV